MASVTNNMSAIHDAEGTLTTANLPSGGGSASANTDIFLQGSQSLGKRVTETAGPSGFVLIDAADNDCSAADVHVGFWAWVTHYGILDDFRVILASGTGSPTNYDSHTFPYATEYPKLGGWLRLWTDVSRTPENSGGSGLNEAALRSYGIQISFTAGPGGSAANVMLDRGDFVAGAALTLTGTTGLWSDFTTADQNSTNQYGVIRLIGGVYNCYARVQLGSSGSSLVMDESNFAIIFPMQTLVADNFMGVNVDIQNASTNIDWTGGVLKSAGTKLGDLVVTGTSGAFDASNMTFSGLRVATFTSVANVTNSAFLGCGAVTAPGTDLVGCSFTGSTVAADTSAVVWDANVDTSGDGDPLQGLDNTKFTKGTAAHHAIELGTTSPTNVTFRGITFTGFNGSNAQNDSVVHVKRTTGAVTINTVNCAGTVSYKTAGATVTIVADTVTASVNVKTLAGANLQNARVFLKASDGTGPFPFEETVTITNSGTTATVSHTGHGMATNDKVVIKGASLQANNGVFSITYVSDNSYTYTMGSSPGSNPTGTIKATFVAIEGLTDANGNISMTRVFSAAQPVTGWVRKASGAPYYKTALLSGSISNTTGYSANVQMIEDV